MLLIFKLLNINNFMSYLFDRVKETTTTTGTNALALGGAVANFRTFASVIATGQPCWYALEHPGASQWETGIGTYTTNILTRTTVTASSNANAVVSLSAGTKFVWIDATANTFDSFQGVTQVFVGTNSSPLTGAVNIPRWATHLELEGVSAGGGGGGGARGSTAADRNGGNGGNGGNRGRVLYRISDLGLNSTGTIHISVGGRGDGGAAQGTNTTDGIAGDDAQLTTVQKTNSSGNYLLILQGGFGGLGGDRSGNNVTQPDNLSYDGQEIGTTGGTAATEPTPVVSAAGGESWAAPAGGGSGGSIGSGGTRYSNNSGGGVLITNDIAVTNNPIGGIGGDGDVTKL